MSSNIMNKIRFFYYICGSIKFKLFFHTLTVQLYQQNFVMLKSGFKKIPETDYTDNHPKTEILGLRIKNK